MEKMPFRAERNTNQTSQVLPASAPGLISSQWRERLPVLAGDRAVLRELCATDAVSLSALLATEEVARFISPPPSSVEGFERFIEWTHRQRTAGTYACFAVTLAGYSTAIGVFQVRQLDGRFQTAEWGFALGSPFWGTGVFHEAAELVLKFAFDILGVRRLEARAAVKNGRGTGALLKLGAVQEGILRKSFLKDGEYFDQGLFAILHDEWQASWHRVAPDLLASVH
jgi:RimJ/RimL family protein N-acetyltransferase